MDRELPGAKSKEPMEIGDVAFVPVGLKMMVDARSCRRSRDSQVGLNLRKARDGPPALLFVFRNDLMAMTSSSAGEPDFACLPCQTVPFGFSVPNRSRIMIKFTADRCGSDRSRYRHSGFGAWQIRDIE